MIKEIMGNVDIIRNNFQPIKANDKSWNAFLESFDNNIFWFPSAGYRFFNLYTESATKDSLFIYTDDYPKDEVYEMIFNPRKRKFNVLGILNITISNIYELEFTSEIESCFWKRAIDEFSNIEKTDSLVSEFKDKYTPFNFNLKFLKGKTLAEILDEMKNDEKAKLIGRIFFVCLEIGNKGMTITDKRNVIYMFVDKEYFVNKISIGLGLECQNLS